MPLKYDVKTLTQVEALYGISEDAAITRLAKEYDADIVARHIEARRMPGYAGAWFDADTLGLVVATNDPVEFAAIKRAGAVPTLVEHSLAQLIAVRANVVKALQSGVGPGALRSASIDVRTNAVRLEIVEDAMQKVSTLVGTLHLDAPVHLVAVTASNNGFSSSLRGADRIRNTSFPLGNGQYSPCSVGASAEMVNGATYTAGFVTAGHCGSLNGTSANDVFVADDGVTTIGTVEQSTFVNVYTAESHNEDGAWVETVSPWVPVDQVNGYSDGIFNVSGTWAGMLKAYLGTTVCRYGSTSGGPFCGTVSSLNAIYWPTLAIELDGMIKVHGTCTEDGDSGGPLVMPTGQVQGTDTGSLNTHSCSGNHSSFDVYFQPIATTLARASSTLSLGNHPIAMLTTHGRSAPTISQFRCPDPNNSGNYAYICNFGSFDSQGITTVAWTTSTGASSDTDEVYDSCTTGPLINVTLTITNPYGSTTKQGSFSCPTYPVQ